MTYFKTVIEVSTGEVGIGGPDTALVANALGSCIAVVAYDPTVLLGGLAHIMLPDRSTKDRQDQRCRYAEDAIETLLSRMEKAGARRERLCIAVAGGANVLKRPDDRICAGNIGSVDAILKRLGIAPRARDVGGQQRRRVQLDVRNGRVLCARGDDREQTLCHFEERSVARLAAGGSPMPESGR